jgi:hypothetical protein
MTFGMPFDAITMRNYGRLAGRGWANPKRLAQVLSSRYRLVDSLRATHPQAYNEVKCVTPILDRSLVYDIVSACVFVCACLCVRVCIAMPVCGLEPKLGVNAFWFLPTTHALFHSRPPPV